MLHRLYLAPSKATPSKLKAIVDDVRDAYAAAESNLGEDFSFLDESDVCDRVIKAILTCPTSTSTLAGPEDFLKYASRRVLDLVGAGELREAIFVRLVTQGNIPFAKRQSLQLASLRQSEATVRKENLRWAVGLVVAGPQGSYDHQLLGRSAWDEVSRGRPITMSLLDEALVTAARERYQKATAAAEGLGRRLDAARGLQAGTGEKFIWQMGDVVPAGIFVESMGYATIDGFLVESESAGNFEWLLEIYDGQGPQVHRGSSASPLGFWAGDA